ncbi:MAG: Na(+)/H(+) antiporter subunit B [Gammaproteobacteria bacterium]|nr:Na(+)/H(+) antiporter subunit B [Gammaproteobacteria bacterium]
MNRNRLLLIVLLPLLLTLAAGLGYAVLSLPEQPQYLQQLVMDNMADSGVSHPVTAVLLNFRAYDTLLEMVVLLLALLAVWSLDMADPQHKTAPSLVLDTLTRLLTPVLILVTAYLLWVGAHAPGGAFQAGSVLAASAVLLSLAGWRLSDKLTALPLRIVLVAGPGVFIILSALSMVLEGQLLKYPVAQAGLFIVILETFATLSIGATLAALFLGVRPGKINKNKDRKHK